MTMPIGSQLRDLRLQAGLTQVDLARTLGISQPTVSYVERGEGPTTTDVLAGWLDACDADLILRRRGAVQPADRLSEAAAALGEQDIERVTHLVEVLARAEGERGIRIRGMLDGIVGVESTTASAPRARSSLG